MNIPGRNLNYSPIPTNSPHLPWINLSFKYIYPSFYSSPLKASCQNSCQNNLLKMEIRSHASSTLTFLVTSHKTQTIDLICKAPHGLVSAYFHAFMSCHCPPYPLCSESHTTLSVLEFIKLICIMLLTQGHWQWISH